MAARRACHCLGSQYVPPLPLAAAPCRQVVDSRSLEKLQGVSMQHSGAQMHPWNAFHLSLPKQVKESVHVWRLVDHSLDITDHIAVGRMSLTTKVSMKWSRQACVHVEAHRARAAPRCVAR